MTIEELKNKIRPDVEATFGVMMANLIFTNAMVKLMNEGKGMDELGKCKKFLECVGSNEKFVGMLGAAGAQNKVASWMSYIK